MIPSSAPIPVTPEQQHHITETLERVRETIAAAAKQAHRSVEDIRLIAVSKTQAPAMIAAALRAGQRDFGESTVQDAASKIPLFQGQSCIWHFIGHVQSNKVKVLPGQFAWVHSVDSPALAARLAQQAHKSQTRLKLLLQVNLTGETQKHGLTTAELFPALEQILKTTTPEVVLRGLMAMGPQGASDTESRRCFTRLRQLQQDCMQRFGLDDFDQLSMGMSHDYAAAIAEGATMVRVGSAIFGARQR